MAYNCVIIISVSVIRPFTQTGHILQDLIPYQKVNFPHAHLKYYISSCKTSLQKKLSRCWRDKWIDLQKSTKSWDATKITKLLWPKGVTGKRSTKHTAF